MVITDWKSFLDTHFPVVIPKGYVKCQECDGHGAVEFERYIVDWNNGGHIEGYEDTCPECDGDGFIREETEDE